MKITELIYKLNSIEKTIGDIDVLVNMGTNNFTAPIEVVEVRNAIEYMIDDYEDDVVVIESI